MLLIHTFYVHVERGFLWAGDIVRVIGATGFSFHSAPKTRDLSGIEPIRLLRGTVAPHSFRSFATDGTNQLAVVVGSDSN